MANAFNKLLNAAKIAEEGTLGMMGLLQQRDATNAANQLALAQYGLDRETHNLAVNAQQVTAAQSIYEQSTSALTEHLKLAQENPALYQDPRWTSVAVFFMLLATLPFVRLIKLLAGETKPLMLDPQVRAYLLWTVYAVVLIVAYRTNAEGGFSEELFRSTLFNVVSIFSGTGYGDGDVLAWGPFAFAILICVGAVGGCSGSTGCSIKVFRYQIALRAISAQIRRIHSPNRVVSVRFDGRAVSGEVIDSIMLLFTCFILSFGVLIVALSATGISFLAAVTAAWTSIFNIGPIFGAEVTASGAIHQFPDAAKWLMVLGMLVGRLEIVSVFVLLLPPFWRA